MDFENNPYASPLCPTSELLRTPGLGVTLAASKWLYRCIRVEMPVQAAIEYNGRGLVEWVAVNGVKQCRKIPIWWFSPCFEFELDTNREPLHVEVRVRVNALTRIRGFQLWLDGVLAYEEGWI